MSLEDCALPAAVVGIFGYACPECGRRFVFLKTYVEHYPEHGRNRALGKKR